MNRPAPDDPRIVDLVFRGGPPPSRRLPALLAAALAHLGLAVWIIGMQTSLEAWSADLAARIHEELVRVEIVDITPPPEPPPPEPATAEPAPPPVVAEPSPTPPPAAPRARLKVGAAPAQAGKIVSAPKGALDLTGDVFVEGQGSAYAGGATTPSGTGNKPAAQVGPPPPAPPAPSKAPPARSRAAPVSLRSDQWSCPWPAQAIDLPLDEQTAIIRVTVRADGVVEASEILEDPGDGFAAAALRCARATRFTPATDAEGRPIRATSPPIRVHFYR
jgi:protein TonB